MFNLVHSALYLRIKIGNPNCRLRPAFRFFFCNPNTLQVFANLVGLGMRGKIRASFEMLFVKAYHSIIQRVHVQANLEENYTRSPRCRVTTAGFLHTVIQ